MKGTCVHILGTDLRKSDGTKIPNFGIGHGGPCGRVAEDLGPAGIIGEKSSWLPSKYQFAVDGRAES